MYSKNYSTETGLLNTQNELLRNFFGVLILLTFSGALNAQLIFDIETGMAWNTKNEIRYPNGEATTSDQFNLPEELGQPNTAFFRLRASYTMADRHTISGLYAPLTFEQDGFFNNPTKFGTYTFAPNDFVLASYKFNSYRLTYRYRIVNREKWVFGVGLTGKVRDARIAVSSGAREDETTDLGFVPLVNFNVEWRPTSLFWFQLKGDALAGTQGRAEDIFAGIQYNLNDYIALKAGYRLLEGGADIDQVYNFATVQYGALGVRVTL